MDKYPHYLLMVAVFGAGLAIGGCSKQTTKDEVDGQPVTSGGDANSTKGKKPNDKPEASKPGPAGKYSLKEIMQSSFKQEGNLKDLILEGKATGEQKAQFIDYVENLAQFKPRKGDAASWKEKTDALIASAKDSDMAALKKTTNCKACHSVHKIYPPNKK